MDNIAVILRMGTTGLGIARSLAIAGIDAYGVDFSQAAVGFSSKSCKKSFIYAHPLENPEKCVEQLVDLGKSLDCKAVLMPSADYYVTLISRFNRVLSEYFLYNIPEPSVLDIIINKCKQYDMAKHVGVPIPTTLSPASMEDLAARQKSLNYPLVIKGANSKDWISAFGNKAFAIECFDDLKKYYALASGKGIKAVVQEMVLGPNKNHYKVCAYYSHERKLLALFCTQKARQFPIDFGIGTLMRSVYNKELIELGEKLFNGIGYTGVGSIEFKKDERDGNFKLIELNPRFWQQSIQATYAGINFPYINYLDCVGAELVPSLNFKEDVRWVDIAEDFRSFLGNRNRGDITLSKWFKSVSYADCHEYFARDDLKPSWFQLKLLVRTLLGKLIRKSHRL